MNRQQRRNAAKNNAANFRKSAHAFDSHLEKNMQQYETEIRISVQNQFQGLMYSVFMLVLRRVCKYGPVRTLRVMQEVAVVINDFTDGVITIHDIKRDVEDADIKVVFDAQYNIIECGIFEEDQYAGARQKVDTERMDLYNKTSMNGLRLWTNPEFEDKLMEYYKGQMEGVNHAEII